jgi:hypothetical protein
MTLKLNLGLCNSVQIFFNIILNKLTDILFRYCFTLLNILSLSARFNIAMTSAFDCFRPMEFNKVVKQYLNKISVNLFKMILKKIWTELHKPKLSLSVIKNLIDKYSHILEISTNKLKRIVYNYSFVFNIFYQYNMSNALVYY